MKYELNKAKKYYLANFEMELSSMFDTTPIHYCIRKFNGEKIYFAFTLYV